MRRTRASDGVLMNARKMRLSSTGAARIRCIALMLDRLGRITAGVLRRMPAKYRFTPMRVTQGRHAMHWKSSETEHASRTAAHWDRFAGTHLNNPTHWEANEAVRRFQWELITGNPEWNPVAWFMERYGPFREMCSLCSGTGILERMIADHWLRDGGTITGFDISHQSVQTASRDATPFKGITYEVRDLDRAIWPASSRYDAVFAHGALHHVSRLDFLLEQVARALSPDGYLYVNDYVGPARFQWSDAQMRLADELLDMLPTRFKAKAKVVRCDAAALATADPSEAAFSNFIVETVQAHFEIVHRVDRGGTLLAPIFGSGCIDPSTMESAEGLAAIDGLCRREHELICESIIPANHVVLIGRPRKKSRGAADTARA